MKSYTIKIAAGQAFELAAVGNYIRVKTAAVALRVQSLENDVDIEIEQGEAALVMPFQRLRISHADAAEQSVILQIGNDSRVDSSKVAGSIAIATLPDVLLENGAYAQTNETIGVVSASLLAANAARRFLLLQNKHATGNVWVNLAGAAATTANGVKLSPGMSLLLDTFCPTGEIFAIGDVAHSDFVAVEG